MWSKSCSCISTTSRSLIRRSTSARSRLTDGRWWSMAIHARPRRACAPGRRKTRARWPQFQGTLAAARRVDRLALHAYAAVGRLAVGARRVFADAYARRFSRAAQGRSVAPAAMGTDGGRGSGRRIDRYGAAARGGCRGRHFRRDARSVVGRQRIAAVVDDGQSIAGVAGGPPGQRRTGGAGALAHRRGVAVWRDDPHRRAGRRGSRSRTIARSASRSTAAR